MQENHRIVEQPRMEGTSKDHLVQRLVEEGAYMKLPSTLSSSILKTSDGTLACP